jgi:signal transduction histidine kinase
MRPFKDQPISRKTLTLGVVPTVCALMVALIASLISTLVLARQNLIADVESQATIVASNVSAGLAFADKRVVDDVVLAIRARSNIDMVCVYDTAGRIFSSFQRAGRVCPAQWPAQTPTAIPIAVRQVLAGNAPVGTVYINSNYGTLLSWMRVQSAGGLFALVCGVLLAVALTRYFQRYLSTPIVDLAATLDRVSASSDYSARAERKTGDEVGRLVDSFNTMLGVIQKKDTERNDLLQKSEESNRVKDEFLATVSHELRTPLNAMLGWLQIIRTANVDPAMLERAMASIERNAKSQARLVEDLIELSRVVTGKLQLRTKPVDLRSVVEASVDVVRTAATAKEVSIKLSLPALPVVVSGDRDRLQQVIWNLLSNAVKFTTAGGTIRVEMILAEDRTTSIVITDSGIGISPDFLPYIFDRFRQADQSTTREHGGLGLGLAIAKEITELHGGSLKASSDGAGRGSRFTLTLPRLTGVDAGGAAPDAPDPPKLTGKRILVVDDEPDSLEIAAEALANTGAIVVQANSGTRALEHWDKAPFDVIICDLAMPGMDGFEVLRRIRGAGGDGTTIIAIALTALASDSDRKAIVAAGFDDHIVKPFSFPDLIRAVSRAA